MGHGLSMAGGVNKMEIPLRLEDANTKHVRVQRVLGNLVVVHKSDLRKYAAKLARHRKYQRRELKRQQKLIVTLERLSQVDGLNHLRLSALLMYVRLSLLKKKPPPEYKGPVRPATLLALAAEKHKRIEGVQNLFVMAKRMGTVPEKLTTKAGVSSLAHLLDVFNVLETISFAFADSFEKQRKLLSRFLPEDEN
eukprot:CAMPEP_0119416586 /NCGR_PEP_ID=MMETSP1335-20130426/13347_1 /TAXON_ID=259385 /ORGANISM="Chrysoculter rhomboideus, Strain RCC1486" /LENGTH=193 /DNA_ID=CAMNT_0007441717 /DNA_START=15 /DNA_END=594 /DNA_ORIENTATION=-